MDQDCIMDQDYYLNGGDYLLCMGYFITLYRKHLITEDEILLVEEKLAKQYKHEIYGFERYTLVTIIEEKYQIIINEIKKDERERYDRKLAKLRERYKNKIKQLSNKYD